MLHLQVYIERADDGSYSAYIPNSPLNYGINGVGDSAKEAIDDFNSTYTAMKDFHKKKGIAFMEATFSFNYDVASFLSYYSKILSLAGLERLTGINQGQLSHYVNGHRKPGKKTAEKIEKKLHEFANDLHQIKFV